MVSHSHPETAERFITRAEFGESVATFTVLEVSRQVRNTCLDVHCSMGESLHESPAAHRACHASARMPRLPVLVLVGLALNA